MSFNFLEQLVSEWYQSNGYFVRQNVLVGKMSRGGHECELDVVALHPELGQLVHIEPSMDADSWSTREKRYEKKFAAGRKHIPELFRGLQIPAEIDQIAIFGVLKSGSRKTIAGGRLQSVDDFLEEILLKVSRQSMLSNAVSEHYPLLRCIQLLSDHREVVMNVWRTGSRGKVS